MSVAANELISTKKGFSVINSRSTYHEALSEANFSTIYVIWRSFFDVVMNEENNKLNIKSYYPMSIKQLTNKSRISFLQSPS